MSTFTNAAAAELRDRISAAIHARLAQRPGDRHLRRNATLVYKAPICTIDAFCLDFLRQWGHLADLDPDFRLCDGLAAVDPREADIIVIAGMGGETIAAILKAAPWVRERGVPLILQPMSSMPELRDWLSTNGCRIAEERLAREGDTLYTAFLVRAGEMPPLTPAELWAGKNSCDPLRGAWLDQWIAKTGWALEGISKARGERTTARRRALEEVHSGLIDMKKEWEAWQQ